MLYPKSRGLLTVSDSKSCNLGNGDLQSSQSHYVSPASTFNKHDGVHDTYVEVEAESLNSVVHKIEPV
jgi:hypothetical protein